MLVSRFAKCKGSGEKSDAKRRSFDQSHESMAPQGKNVAPRCKNVAPRRKIDVPRLGRCRNAEMKNFNN